MLITVNIISDRTDWLQPVSLVYVLVRGISVILSVTCWW